MIYKFDGLFLLMTEDDPIYLKWVLEEGLKGLRKKRDRLFLKPFKNENDIRILEKREEAIQHLESILNDCNKYQESYVPGMNLKF